MYFPPDSWNKFKPNVLEVEEYDVKTGESATKIYIQGTHEEYSYESATKILYKKILEVLQVPIINPKTGEQDYVDIEKVSQIIVDPITVYNLEDPSKVLKVSYEIKGVDQSSIELTATPGSAKHEKEVTLITLNDFENMIAKCVYSESDMRLENVDDFRGRMNILLSNIISKRKSRNEFYVEAKVDYKYENGIGLIYDEKLQREIGTFEDITVSYNSGVTAQIRFPFLQGKQIQDIKGSASNYLFTFYSLKDNCVFNIKTNEIIKSDGKTDVKLFAPKSSITIESFDENHEKYNIVATANESKSILQSLSKLDLNDQMNKMHFDEFKEGRLLILKDSQDKAKKQKIVNQFADIELL